MFSIHQLAKQGRVIDVSREMINKKTTVAQLAEYLEPVLTAAAGGSLDAYCT